MTDSEEPPSLPESDARRLAEIARVPEASFVRFREMLEAQIWMANLSVMEPDDIPRASDVKRSLSRVATIARRLDKALGALLVKDNGRPSDALAGSCLETALDGAAGEVTATGSRLAAYRHWLEMLIAAIEVAGNRVDMMLPLPPPSAKNKKRAGRPRGAGGNPAFDNFVKRLYEIVRQTGGRPWTHNRKSQGDGWSGTLEQALNLLRPCLPESDFFPKAKLGFVLDRLAKRYGSDARQKLTPR